MVADSLYSKKEVKEDCNLGSKLEAGKAATESPCARGFILGEGEPVTTGHLLPTEYLTK